MSTNHTPTPFKTCSIGTAVMAKRADGHSFVVAFMRGDNADERSFEERKADAAFIVQALNTHDQLVAALNDIAGMDGEAARIASLALINARLA